MQKSRVILSIIASGALGLSVWGANSATPTSTAKIEKKKETSKVSVSPKQKRKITFKTDAGNATGIYKIGETITLKAQMLENDQPVKGKFVSYYTSINGMTGKKIIVPSDEVITVTGKLDAPGWMALCCSPLDENKKTLHTASKPLGVGVLVEPYKIQRSSARPADFDAFWKLQREELNKVELKVVSKVEVPVLKKLTNKVVCYDVKVSCLGDKPVSGYLVMPKDAKPKSLPAIVSFHGAGIRSSNKLYGYGIKAIAFDVNAHGIENGNKAEYYRELNKKDLRGYRTMGMDDRNKMYFRGMYLRVMRALDYVKSLPEWDGKNLIVTGGSQGGAQSIVAAALDKQVTLCVAGVPALCDHSGSMVGRRQGWPMFYTVKNGKPAKDAPVVVATAYYDNVNFASLITCETFFSTGMMDYTCSPTSVFAAYNQLPVNTKKAIDIHPAGNHGTSRVVQGSKRIAKILGL